MVETDSGRVGGSHEAGLHVFRGVPFAAPPLGELRFRPPAPHPTWSGVRDARRFGPGAPQRAGPLMHLVGAADLPTSEDCLTLNLWTPGLDGSRRPILFWVHGGGYTTGCGAMPMFDGALLARRGEVVVVSCNYRLGALGFLGIGEDGQSIVPGNLGLRDQIAALEWLRAHALRFGGDPDKITVFGESAGAMSLGVLLGIPRGQGLFRRAVLQSGAPAVTAPDEASNILHWLLEDLDLGPKDGERLRLVASDRLLNAQDRVNAEHWRDLSGLAFQPVVDGDLVPAEPRESLGTGAGRGVDLLVGTNLDECRYWAVTDSKARSMDHAGLLRRCGHHVRGEDATGRLHAARLVDAYRTARAGQRSTAPPDLWFAIETDRLFRVPASVLAGVQSRWAPTYMYLFTWASPALDGVLGSCHGLEVPFVFGTLQQPAMRFLAGEGTDAHALSLRMQDAWVSFARDGCPDGERWPAYEPERRATHLLGRECRVEEAPFETERRIWKGLL